mmetsp:Transcript_16502/g.36454  ORF Transcript_16502/g.36454 Transcript_16502/m.36454 type:complete len:251 (-) Transcript_16502:65-817(-)|eukprot:CAMPEP_0204359640 /NCGR_PEP_ID=MMETSP0469-20131031/37414_1 /ASSEMBLY_ACC=CAM_ASM_000384 /TAXON_ID=2969 /ORGANISM="Oxyrrhis marina" /LENGTH=250 /DNA_ID=CAMNT_0051347717 /DNA_START=34 /DNA_END=786 /DNA_ORIENTATION=+
MAEKPEMVLGLVSAQCVDVLLGVASSGASPEVLGCTKQLVLNGLNLAVIVGAIAVKVPQLLKILAAGNAKGLSELTPAIEIVGNSFNAAYFIHVGAPFKNWGEAVFLNLQCAVQLLLTWHYTSGLSLITRVPFVCLYLAFLAAVYSDAIPADVYPVISLSVAVLFTAARAPQIFLNFKQGHTGQLSLVTYTLNVLGNMARFATTFLQVGDPFLIGTVVAIMSTNVTLVLQILYYWDATNSILATESKKTK